MEPTRVRIPRGARYVPCFALLTIFYKADIMICLFLLYRNHLLRKIFAMLFSAFKGIYLNISFLTCVVTSTCTLFFHPNLHISAL